MARSVGVRRVTLVDSAHVSDVFVTVIDDIRNPDVEGEVSHEDYGKDIEGDCIELEDCIDLSKHKDDSVEVETGLSAMGELVNREEEIAGSETSEGGMEARTKDDGLFDGASMGKDVLEEIACDIPGKSEDHWEGKLEKAMGGTGSGG